MRRVPLPLLIIACLGALFLINFRSVLWGNEQFAFRDAANFYYPLYQRVQAEWDAGRWPLWEPEENGGMPLLGNPTAAVLYPGKIIYAALPYPWAARVYIMAHVLLAFAAMMALMRSWATSWTGSALAALSYAFGAPVLFAYSNVVFLVGAAWLPFGFRAVDRWLRLGQRKALLELAVILAVQTLGGDPEAAYVLGVCAGGYALGLAGSKRFQNERQVAGLPLTRPLRVKNPLPQGERAVPSSMGLRRSPTSPLVGEVPAQPGVRGHPATRHQVLLALGLLAAWVAATLFMARWAPSWRAHEPPPRPLPWMGTFHHGVLAAWLSAAVFVIVHRLRRGSQFVLGTMFLGLAGAAVLAAMLAAAQLIPVWEFTGRSMRAAEGTHNIFSFSLEPARLLGLLWPNVYGDNLTRNRSWFETLPPLGQHVNVWAPSLYFGGLTLVLALATLGFRGGPPWRAWLTGVAVISLWASLGEYSSPLWWARWIPAVAQEVGPHDPPLTDPIRPDFYLRDGDGGVYWMLASFLPGFGQFRFPSKLLVFTTLALAALGGLGWDRLSTAPRQRGPRWEGEPPCEPLPSGMVFMARTEARPPQGVGRRTLRIALVLLTLTLACLALAVGNRAWIMTYFAQAARGFLAAPSGPFDVRGAYRELCSGLAQGTLVLALTCALVLFTPRRPARAAALALILTTADLALANSRYVLTVPQRLMDAEPKVVDLINHAERHDPAGQPFRVHRMPLWFPYLWTGELSQEREREIVAWERDTLDPQYGLPFGIPYTLTMGTAELYDYEWFFVGSYLPVLGGMAPTLGLRPGDPIFYWPRRGFDLWNTRYFVVPAYPHGWKDRRRSYAAFLDQTDQLYPPADAFTGPRKDELRKEWMYREDLQVYRNRAAYPRAWVVHQARFHPPIAGLGPRDRTGPIGEILFANDALWNNPRRQAFNPRALAWFEDNQRPDLAAYLPGIEPQAAEAVTVTSYEPQRVVLDAVLQQPGLIILADVHYPGWRLTIDGNPAPIYRANLLMRAAAVRAGKHRIVYTYEPQSFDLGRWASVGGLAVLAALTALFRRRPVAPYMAVDKGE